MTTPNSTPAGWYDDGSGRQRWWDGQQWGIFADEFSAQASTTDGSASADASSSSDASASATSTDTAAADTSAADIAAAAGASEASASVTSASESSGYDAPATETSSTGTPAYEAPSSEVPAYEAPATETPAYETPAYEAPATQPPAYQAPSAPETSAFTAPGASASDAPAYAGAPAYQAPGAANPYGTPGAPNQAYPGAAPAYPGSGAPAYAGAYGAAGEPKKKLNVVALISAIVGALGFIFACIPGALIVGWILLPAAFVLSIVSLFLKGDKKWLGFVGLGLSILGTIVGFIVFFAVLATSFDNAFGGSDTSVTQPSDEAEDEGTTDEGTTDEGSTDGAEGSRENPYPVGSEISNSDWTVVINSVNPDGNAVVSEANQFNEPAPAGSHYEIVNYTVTYTGADSSYAAEVQVDAVLSSGSVVGPYDALVVLSDDFGFDELYAGGTITGSVAYLVPDGDTYVLRVTPGILADEVFIQP